MLKTWFRYNFWKKMADQHVWKKFLRWNTVWCSFYPIKLPKFMKKHENLALYEIVIIFSNLADYGNLNVFQQLNYWLLHKSDHFDASHFESCPKLTILHQMKHRGPQGTLKTPGIINIANKLDVHNILVIYVEKYNLSGVVLTAKIRDRENI